MAGYLCFSFWSTQKKNVILSSVETLPSEPYHETASQFRYENSKFHRYCPYHCNAVKAAWNLQVVPRQI
jgi:hypothetical protein